jgi:hypothetical protein
MAPPSGKTNATDVLATPDTSARLYVGEQVYLLASQVRQLDAIVAEMKRTFPSEAEQQQAATTFTTFFAEVHGEVDSLQHSVGGRRSQHPAFSTEIAFHSDPHNSALGPLLAVQRLGSAADAVGLSVVALHIAGQAANNQELQRRANNIGTYSARIHRWCIGQIKAKAAHALAVPV